MAEARHSSQFSDSQARALFLRPTACFKTLYLEVQSYSSKQLLNKPRALLQISLEIDQASATFFVKSRHKYSRLWRSYSICCNYSPLLLDLKTDWWYVSGIGHVPIKLHLREPVATRFSSAWTVVINPDLHKQCISGRGLGISLYWPHKDLLLSS